MATVNEQRFTPSSGKIAVHCVRSRTWRVLYVTLWMVELRFGAESIFRIIFGSRGPTVTTHVQSFVVTILTGAWHVLVKTFLFPRWRPFCSAKTERWRGTFV